MIRIEIDDALKGYARSASPFVMGALVLGGAGLVAIGMSRLVDGAPTIRNMIPFVLGAIAMVLSALMRGVRIVGEATGRVDSRPMVPLKIVLPLVILTLIVFFRAAYRADTASATDIVVLLGIALLLTSIAAFWGSHPRQLGDWFLDALVGLWSPTTLLWAIVLLAAAIPRLIMLDRFPTIIENDEGVFMMEMRRAMTGDLPNPFAVNSLRMPDTIVMVQGLLARWFGESIALYRSVYALFGIASVILVWVLGRRLFGTAVGFASALILAFMPLHLWASRNALNNIVDAAVAAGMLLFLDRAVTQRSRRDAIFCGVFAGIGWHAYHGGRVFIAFALAGIVGSVVHAATRMSLREMIRLGWWTAVGFAAMAAPVLGYFWTHQDELFARQREVNDLMANYSIDQRIDFVGYALAYPFADQTHGYAGQIWTGFFKFGPPFLGWIVAPLVMLGVLDWIIACVRGVRDAQASRVSPLLLTWLVLAVSVSQTQGIEAQRQLGIAVLWALAAGTGLVVAAQLLATLIPRGAMLARVAIAGVLLVNSGWMASAHFTEDQQFRNYSEVKSLAGWDAGWRISQLEETPTVVLGARPGFTIESLRSWRYLVPDQTEHLVDLPDWGSAEYMVPVLGENEVAVILFTRPIEELCAIQAANPDARVGQAVARDGELLYTVFSTASDLVLPEGSSPGESVLTPVASLSCEQGPS